MQIRQEPLRVNLAGRLLEMGNVSIRYPEAVRRLQKPDKAQLLQAPH